MAERWRVPSWYRQHIKADQVTDAQLAAWRAELVEVNAHNNAAAKEVGEAFRELVADAERLYGAGHSVVKYLRKARAPVCPHYSLNDLAYRVKQTREAAAKVEHEKRMEAALVALLAEAVAWLLARGKKLGEDFTGEDAIAVANNIAADEEIARLTEHDGSHDFDGQNCDGPCDGWDGESRRCNCGNRRVSWTTGWGHSFKEPHVYGEAY